MDLLAILISVLAIVISLFQYFSENKRKREEATINAISDLQDRVFNNERFSSTNVDCILEAHERISDAESTESIPTDEEWEFVSDCLAQIERFSVGVNTHIYNEKIVDRVAGSYIIELYGKFSPIIEYKRKKHNTNKRYVEFEKMVHRLSDIDKRNKKKFVRDNQE